MTVVFLIGGTGNQLFSYAASKPQDTFSSIFLTRRVRKVLGWTLHEQVLIFPKPKLTTHSVAVLVLLLDLVLAALIGKTLFTVFDTRKIKAEPLLFEFARLGYFQQSRERRDVFELADQIAPKRNPGQIALHVRGGDLLRRQRTGQNTYGMLNDQYYREGIAVALADLADQGQQVKELLVLTDDPEYGASFDLNVEGAPTPQIRSCPLAETLSLAVGADWFVSSNSTMSYWILRLRAGRRNVAPRPFQRRLDYIICSGTVRIGVDF